MIAATSLVTRGIVFPDDAEAADRARTGGKGAGLARLRDAGCNVPPWFVVTPDWTLSDRAALEFALARLTADDAHAACAHLPQCHREPPQCHREPPQCHREPPQCHREPPQCHPELVEGCAAAATFAVRSSALVEDGATASFAGQFTSVLFVPRDGVADAIRRVRESAANESVHAYANGARDIAMAVVVQRMISGEASGVAFGVDPIDGSDVAVITAAPGLVNAVVNGDALTDTWRVTRGGTIAETAVAEERAAPVLGDDEVHAVASLVRRIANACGVPQDVEFTFAGGTLWALQARPVTAAAGAPVAIWDDSNIAESYGGVVGALTYSFARTAYAGAYRAFFRLVAVPRALVDADAATFDGLVGRIEGRMMYDLVRWYRMLALLPGYRLNRRLMEEMMGVREAMPAEIADAIARDCRRGKLRDAAMLARTTIALGVASLRLPSEVERFHAHVDGTLATGPDLERASLTELAREYRRLERALLGRWDVPIANDFFVMLSFGLLKRAASAWCGDPSLGAALLAGSGGMLSAEPARAVRRLAALDAAGERATYERELAAYLARFGDRCESELKLESPTLHDDPRPLLEAIARLRGAGSADAVVVSHSTIAASHSAIAASHSAIAGSDDAITGSGDAIAGSGDAITGADDAITGSDDAITGSDAAAASADNTIANAVDAAAISEDAGSALRLDAERRVRDALRGRPLRALVFAGLAGWARARIVARENLRFERTRVFGRVRRIALAMGRRLAQRGAIDEARDVFDLTIDELLGYAEGNTACRELRALAAVRRAERARYAAAPPPPNRFATRDLPVAPLLAPRGAAPLLSPRGAAPSDETLQGSPSCAGVVRGRVHVVRDPHETLRAGEILVAERTDPSWVVLFPAAAAILVERGSQLSHAAIVSREMGIPSIVALRGLTSWLRTGDLVELDGATGVVRRLERAS
jgi:rifampicin phosphotransferase